MCCSSCSTQQQLHLHPERPALMTLEGFQRLQKDLHPRITGALMSGLLKNCMLKEKLVCAFRASGGESASAPGAHPPRPGVPVLQSAAAAHVPPAPHLTVAHHDH